VRWRLVADVDVVPVFLSTTTCACREGIIKECERQVKAAAGRMGALKTNSAMEASKGFNAIIKVGKKFCSLYYVTFLFKIN
jgi:hypothetical protein